MKLRPYQDAAVNAVLREWDEHGSTLVVLPTGCGKTIVFAEVIRRMRPARAMVLAHREELIFQARDKIQRVTGFEAQVEMADYRADLAGLGAPVHSLQDAAFGGVGETAPPCVRHDLGIGARHHRRRRRFSRIFTRPTGSLRCD